MNQNGTVQLLFERARGQDQDALDLLIWARWGSLGKAVAGRLFEKIYEVGKEFPDVWERILQGSPRTITR